MSSLLLIHTSRASLSFYPWWEDHSRLHKEYHEPTRKKVTTSYVVAPWKAATDVKRAVLLSRAATISHVQRRISPWLPGDKRLLKFTPLSIYASLFLAMLLLAFRRWMLFVRNATKWKAIRRFSSTEYSFVKIRNSFCNCDFRELTYRLFSSSNICCVINVFLTIMIDNFECQFL